MEHILLRICSLVYTGCQTSWGFVKLLQIFTSDNCLSFEGGNLLRCFSCVQLCLPLSCVCMYVYAGIHYFQTLVEYSYIHTFMLIANAL